MVAGGFSDSSIKEVVMGRSSKRPRTLRNRDDDSEEDSYMDDEKLNVEEDDDTEEDGEEEAGDDDDEIDDDDDGEEHNIGQNNDEIEELEKEYMELRHTEQDLLKNLKRNKDEDLLKGQAVKNQKVSGTKLLSLDSYCKKHSQVQTDYLRSQLSHHFVLTRESK